MMKEFCRNCGTKPAGSPPLGQAPVIAKCPTCGVPDPYKHPKLSIAINPTTPITKQDAMDAGDLMAKRIRASWPN